MHSFRSSLKLNLPQTTDSIRARHESHLILDRTPAREVVRRFNDPTSWFPYTNEEEYLQRHAFEIEVQALETDWCLAHRFPWYVEQVGLGPLGAKLVVVDASWGQAIGWVPFYNPAKLDVIIARVRSGGVVRRSFRPERCVLSTLAERIYRLDGVARVLEANALREARRIGGEHD
jgi:hypothetical protein